MITGSKQACDSFSADGSGARAALYYSSPKKLYGWGSEELVTRFLPRSPAALPPDTKQIEPGLSDPQRKTDHCLKIRLISSSNACLKILASLKE